LNNNQSAELMKKLENHFDAMVEIPGIKNGKHQTFETLINEEAFLFGKLLRTEIRI